MRNQSSYPLLIALIIIPLSAACAKTSGGPTMNATARTRASSMLPTNNATGKLDTNVVPSSDTFAREAAGRRDSGATSGHSTPHAKPR